MGDKTKIEWSQATWNPIVGCSLVSPGCTNCYAMKMAARIEKLKHGATHYAGTTKPSKAGAVWTGKLKRAPRHILEQPLRWTRPRMIFANSMSDLFHEDVPDEWIDEIFAIMALCPQHTFQILTKRADRMRKYMTETWQPAPAQKLQIGDTVIEREAETKGDTRRDRVMAAVEGVLLNGGFNEAFLDTLYDDKGSLKAIHAPWPLKNVHLGVSVEDQERADERIPQLIDTPAAVRFISAEPLLGPIDISWNLNNITTSAEYGVSPRLDWVIVGGESGPAARPMHPDWARSLRDQCKAGGVPFFFKQYGNWLRKQEAEDIIGIDDPRISDSQRRGGARLTVFQDEVFVNVGKHDAGRVLDGRTWDEMPRAA